MATHNDIGKQGEQFALTFLKNTGYEILCTNWRYSRAEIDIIAKKNEVLIFVEVKTRSSSFFGKPSEFVDAKKEMLMADAAAQYMLETGHDWEIRFDVISVIVSKQGLRKIEHFKDAFFPGL